MLCSQHRPHIVKIAADGFQDPDCHVRFMESHRQIAVHLAATSLPVTYIAPSLYMENLLESAETIREQATIFAPAGTGRAGFAAASDVAKAAAHILTSQGHEDRTYVVTGPEALSYADVAARVSAVFARQVDYQDMPEHAAKDQMLASGLTSWQTDGTIELFEWFRRGGFDSATSSVRELAGTDARPLEDWLGELRGAFLSQPADPPPPPA
jgi:NAD(P)H dehydrogenase (quinone)